MADDAAIPARSSPTLEQLRAAGHELAELAGQLGQQLHEEQDKTAALHKLAAISITYGPDLIQLVIRIALEFGGIPLPKAV